MYKRQADALRDIIAEEMTPEAEMDLSGKPAVILVIGVNGVGKTTSIAKLADYYTRLSLIHIWPPLPSWAAAM